MQWIEEHIIEVLLAGLAVTWLTGFFNRILPSPSNSINWIIECVKDIWGVRPSRDKFLILVSRLEGDDSDGNHTRAIGRVFYGHQGIERTLTRRVLHLSDIGSEAESQAVATGRRWLTRRNADLLIWGEVLQKEKFLNLWFISKDATSDFQQSRFMLEANLLDQNFGEATRAQLVAIALSAIPATEVAATSHRDILGPVAERLRNLINDSSEFTLRQRSNLSLALGITLCAISHEEGGPKGPQDAVSFIASSIEGIDRTKEPLLWANAQHWRGVALTAVGQEMSGSEALEDAVLAFHAALDERTKERVPLEWAKTQNALGVALSQLGARKTRTSYFAEAITAFDSALTERTLERTPIEWAATMSNRGMSVLQLAHRDKIGANQITDAIFSFQEALRATSPATTPILWGGITLNLGLAYVLLAIRRPEGSPLDDALSAFRSVLFHWSREQVPRLWVKAQINVGQVLTRRGEHEIGTDSLREAVDVFQAALEVCTREFSTPSWAIIHALLAIALVRIAERELAIQGPLQDQILRFDTQQQTDWIIRQQALEAGIGRLQQREDGLNHLEEAVAAFRNSLDYLPRDRLPLDWADAQHNFAVALTRLGEQEEGTEYLLEALSTVNLALEVWTDQDFPFNCAIAQNTIAWISIRLGERETETSTSRYESAIAACRKALQVQTQRESPLQRALTQNHLGIALYRLGAAQGNLVRLRESEDAYCSALEVYRSISAERDIELVDKNLRIVQVHIQSHPNFAE
jgi:tetratricopeptide (TPR) repeat protein